MMQNIKEGNVSWIKEIPKNWELRRTKYCFTVNHGSDPKTDSGDTPVYGSGNSSFKTCEEFKIGPAVLVGRKGTLNIPQWVEGHYWNVDTSFDVQPKGNYNLRLYYYCANCFDYDCVATQTALPSMTQTDYLNFKLPFMDIDIQNKIVSYLDAKCDAIDKAIAYKRSVIEKLKEYRTAVITKAVTKGLNPDVEMKNSGIVWIGQIPINWQISKIKFLIETGENGMKIDPFGSALKGVTLSKGPVKIYNQANLIAENFDISKHYISAETYERLKSYTINAGDILFSMMGTIGKCRIMPKGKPIGIMDSHLLKARLNTNKVLPEFFVYAFDKDRNPATLEQLIYSSQGSIMNGLNSSIVKTIKLAVPDIKEQRQIVDYLDAKCSKIDSAIHQQEQAIAKLEEYRKSVIYYAVTGKIDCGKAV